MDEKLRITHVLIHGFAAAHAATAATLSQTIVGDEAALTVLTISMIIAIARLHGQTVEVGSACYLWIERKIMDTENIIDNLASNRNAGNDYSIIVIQRETEKRKLMLDKYIKTKGWVVGTIFFIVFFYILLKIFYS